VLARWAPTRPGQGRGGRGGFVADRDQEKAAQLAAELGPTATPLALDISDAEALARALAAVDIVLNTAGPFYRFGREVLSAAIAAGTKYLDICDGWEPTLRCSSLTTQRATQA
jgi:saccharopine dehydrogenase-like NADP-dependent oxidoreductase